MAVNLSMLAGAGAQFFDNNGDPLTGGKLYTYAAGTTTPLAAYTTSAGNVAHANPIILDAAGRTPSGGEIWLTDAVDYKFVLATSTDVVLGTFDNVAGNGSGIFASLASSSGSSLVGFLQSGAGAVARTVQSKLRDTVSIIDFGADPTGVADSTSAIQDAVDAAGQNGLIYYPAGTYKMLGTVTLLPEQTHFGHDAILDIDPTVPNGFELTTNGFPGRIKFENLKFNTSAKNGIAISITNNTPFVQINNCFFDGFSTAVYLDGSYCSNIVNSYFNDCFQGVILVAECHSTQLINCFFDYCLYGGVCINGNQTIGNLGSDTHNISIIGCAIQNGEFGVWAEACYELQLINIYHEGNTKQDLRIGVGDAGTYARACYHVNIDNWQSASPCGSGVNIGIEHSVNVNMRGMSWNSGCSTTATLLSIDGFSDFIQVDYNNYTTSVVTSTAPFNFAGDAAKRTVVLHNGRPLFPRSMTDAIQFGTLVTQPEKIYSSTTPSGRPALFLQSVGTDQDMVVKVTGIERHQNAAGVDQFYVDHVNGQVVSEYLMKAKLGVVMTTPDGTKNYRIWIDNSGNLTSTLV